MKIKIVFSCLFLIFIKGLIGFKSEFEYYKQIYMNSTNYVIQLQYNFTKMETTSMNLINLCAKAPDLLKKMMDQVDSVIDSDFKPEYRILEQKLPFQEAKDSCNLVGPGCEMASISSMDEKHAIMDVMNEHGIKDAYLRYESITGDIVSHNMIVLNHGFMTEQKFQALTCPESFQYIP